MLSKEAKGIDWCQVLLSSVEKKGRRKCPLRFKQTHALFLTTGLALHSYPFSRLLLFSSLPPLSGGLLCLLLRSPLPPSPFLSNTLISSLCSSGHPSLALYIHSLLPSLSNPHTFPSLLKSCSSSPPLLPFGLALHSRILKLLPFPLDPVVLTSLAILHSRRDRPRACRHLFDQIPRPDLPAWNAILSCHSRSALSAGQALSLFQRLQLSPAPQPPNEITLVAVMVACGHLGALSHGAWAHAYILRGRHLVLNRFVAAALITMYSNCGRLGFARRVFDEFPDRDVACCNAMIRGLSAHGDGRGALALFEGVQKGGLCPDAATFLSTLSACAHAGMVEEGRRCFARMEREFGISPGVEHYGCLVDILGRAGKLDEAERVARGMPLEPNAALFRSLLGACRIHGKFGSGEKEKAILKLVELEPNYGGNYVLLSNIYAECGVWDGAVLMREVMRERGIGKNPGLSIIEIDGFLEVFAMGDQTHPLTKEIFAMVRRIFVAQF